jgi:hypothetical protein
MRKSTVESSDAARPGQAGSRPLRIASVVLIVVVLTPLVVECATLCHAQWSGILGGSTSARTPILDWIRESLVVGRRDLRMILSPNWSRMAASPRSVLSVAAIAIAVGILILRLSSHRLS